MSLTSRLATHLRPKTQLRRPRLLRKKTLGAFFALWSRFSVGQFV